MGKLENEIQNSILDWLWYNHIFAWRNNNFARYSKTADRYFKMPKYSINGVSDILGILPDGRFLAIEVKTPIGVVSKDQKEFLKNVNDNGGVGFVAKKIEDINYLKSKLC